MALSYYFLLRFRRVTVRLIVRSLTPYKHLAKDFTLFTTSAGLLYLLHSSAKRNY